MPKDIKTLFIIPYPPESEKLILAGKSNDGTYYNLGPVEFKGELNIAKTDILYDEKDGYVSIYSQMPFSAFYFGGKYEWDKNTCKLTLIKSWSEDPSAESLKNVETYLSEGKIDKARDSLLNIMYPGHYYNDNEMAVKFLKSAHKEGVKEYRDGSNDSWKLMSTAITTFDYLISSGRWIFQFTSKKNYEKSPFNEYMKFEDFIVAVNDYGFLLEQDGKEKEAVYTLQYVLKLSPDRTPAHINLADALYKSGSAEEAKKYYKSYIDLMKKDGNEKNIPKRVYERI